MPQVFLPRSQWASSPFLGANVSVYDEANAEGFWTGIDYAPASTADDIRAAASPSRVASAITTHWPMNEGAGTQVNESTMLNVNATAVGSTTDIWTARPGLTGNGSLKMPCTRVTAQQRRIFNLASLKPGAGQVVVWWILTHPTTPSGNGGIFCYGLLGDNAKGGWGVRMDSASQWLVLSILPIGGTLIETPLDINQPGLKLQVNGTNTATACCLVIERSTAPAGHLVVKFYAHPLLTAEAGQQPCQTLLTIPEPVAPASLPKALEGELTWMAFTSTNQAGGFTNVMGSQHAVANFGAHRRAVPLDAIGARIAKELVAAMRAGNYYTKPASADL